MCENKTKNDDDGKEKRTVYGTVYSIRYVSDAILGGRQTTKTTIRFYASNSSPPVTPVLIKELVLYAVCKRVFTARMACNHRLTMFATPTAVARYPHDGNRPNCSTEAYRLLVFGVIYTGTRRSSKTNDVRF